ncbi:hypothetical protein EDF87_110140 [Pseudomonas helmanticensis]|uniref:Uncharacterized protein n=1 Tax=Pseudomonas helmanticensis TaxID=1471381 RepID=A0A4R7V716_9PSED|nr:hypothetical protein EDF87_110140 [Pseudomonas helmanticensis]
MFVNTFNHCGSWLASDEAITPNEGLYIGLLMAPSRAGSLPQGECVSRVGASLLAKGPVNPVKIRQSLVNFPVRNATRPATFACQIPGSV